MKKYASSLVYLLRLLSLGISFLSFGVDGQTPFFSQCVSPSPTFQGITVYARLCVTQPANVASFSQFCAALDSAAPQMAQIKSLLQSSSARVTVFAPTDAAFQAMRGPMPTGRELTRLIQLHILNQPVLTSDLGCGETVRTLDVLGPSQRTITNCRTGGTTVQRGSGNTASDRPIIGVPNGAFDLNANTAFQDTELQNIVTALFPGNPWVEIRADGTLSENLPQCNGIIHVVNNVLRGSTVSGAKGGKSGKKSGKNGGYYDGYYDEYYGNYYRRALLEDDEDNEDLEEYDDENADEDANEDNKMNEGDNEEERQLESDIEQNANTNANADEDNDVNEEDNGQRRLERRKQTLEALLEPNGDIEILN